MREGVGVDGSGDSIADSTANTGEKTDHRQNNGDVVTIRCTHTSHLLSNHQHSTGEGNEDLAHNHVSDISVLATEMDHQTRAQEHERDSEEKTRVLELLGPADPHAEDGGPDAGSDGVDTGHVTG